MGEGVGLGVCVAVGEGVAGVAVGEAVGEALAVGVLRAVEVAAGVAEAVVVGAGVAALVMALASHPARRHVAHSATAAIRALIVPVVFFKLSYLPACGSASLQVHPTLYYTLARPLILPAHLPLRALHKE